jgi:GT2 family glycosyltransferase
MGPYCVIVNYRTAALTLRSLDALLGALVDLPDARVLIVDNDSQDGSYETLCKAVRERGVEDRVEVVASPMNGGFGYGCNIGIARNAAREQPAKYIYILNSDAFPEPQAVRALVEFMESHPQAGFAASCVIDRGGNLRHPARRFPSIWSELDKGLRLGIVSRLLSRWEMEMQLPPSDEPIKADWVGGVSMLLRKRTLDEIGVFDDGYFLYFEEVDLMFRGAQRGWESWLVPESRVGHVGSASTGLGEVGRPRPSYWFRARTRFLRKAYGPAYLLLTNLVWVSAFATWRVRRAIQGKADTDPPGMLVDFIRYSGLKG